MPYYERRPGLVPLASAVLLSLAAGLSLAEEHAWHHPEVPAAPTSHAADKTTPTGKDQSGSTPGVGSRALTGHEAEDHEAQEPIPERH